MKQKKKYCTMSIFTSDKRSQVVVSFLICFVLFVIVFVFVFRQGLTMRPGCPGTVD